MKRKTAVTIRVFRIDDYDEVLTMWNGAEGLEICEGDSREEIKEYLQRNPGISRVAELNGAVIGAVLCGHDGRRGHIYHLAVSPEYRGRGIARQLVEECFNTLRAAGIRRATILVAGDNSHGHDFWRGSGWEDITGAIAMTREV